VLSLTPDMPFEPGVNLLELAVYHPTYSPLHIPERCPDYLAGVLAMAGLDYAVAYEDRVPFRTFVARVPMVAADARAVPMDPAMTGKDPVERVQFVVFQPNQLTLDREGPRLPLAAFAARTRSGNVIRTSLKELSVLHSDLLTARVRSVGTTRVAVPQPGAVTVSALGIATVHFLGLGETEDYSLVVNPRNPTDSYMVVFRSDGHQCRYRLEADPAGDNQAEDWVIAYAHRVEEEWPRLSVKPGPAPARADTLFPADLAGPPPEDGAAETARSPEP
jgi:hypothetical protein